MSHPYFTVVKAKRLIQINPGSLSNSRLQAAIVKLRDYERYVKNTDIYGDVLTKGGYFARICDPSASGVTPVDIWLSQNLTTALNEALTERKTREEPT